MELNRNFCKTKLYKRPNGTNMIEDFCPVQKRQMDGNTRKLEENLYCKHLRENPLSLQTNPSTFLGVVY